MKIFLIDAGPVLLSPMSKQSQDEACRVLKKLGVHIITGNAVKSYENEVVSLADGTTIKTTVLIWTSGVLARAVNGLPETVIGKGRRIKVNEINLVAGTSNVFALGDQCIQMTDKKYPEGHPQVAQVAIQQGNRLAHNLVRILDKKPPLAFAYRDKGTMAIISKYKAVADLPQVSFKGFAAWFVWLFIHIIPLIGFRNKLMLAFNWLWSFISNNPTLRLIVRRGREEERGNT